MKKSSNKKIAMSGVICGVLSSCVAVDSGPKTIPALEYARSLGGGKRQDVARAEALSQTPEQRHALRSRPVKHSAPQGIQDGARFRLASNEVTGDQNQGDVVTNIPAEIPAEADFQMHESTTPNSRDYNGPLSLGDPGVSASLWQESRGETSLFHDFRAWQPMDIITILITERAEGRKQADTNVKTESTFQTAIENIFGFENDVVDRNSTAEGDPKVDLKNLINASAESEYKGEGRTGRTDSLRAQISAMVVEVLPGGLLRIEGERIISMNNEEQIMVVSGLARTRDINSENQIDSARIANLRVDYFGRGVVGSAQYGGWLSNLLRMIWPF